jgi:hypothetical protein
MMRELGLDDDIDEQAFIHLTDPRFVALGYDLVKDDVEDFLPDLLVFARAEGVDLDRIESRALLPVVDGSGPPPPATPGAICSGGSSPTPASWTMCAAPGARRRSPRRPPGPAHRRRREPRAPARGVQHCRRVIHHDLAWNPAQLEQRVGRVDRLGSLVQRLRDRKPETTLDVLLPLIANTIDERLGRTVRLRERWLEFLLGAAPSHRRVRPGRTTPTLAWLTTPVITSRAIAAAAAIGACTIESVGQARAGGRTPPASPHSSLANISEDRSPLT